MLGFGDDKSPDADQGIFQAFFFFIFLTMIFYLILFYLINPTSYFLAFVLFCSFLFLFDSHFAKLC